MSKKTTLIINIILWVIIAVSSVLVVSLISSITDPMDEAARGWVDVNLKWTYGLLFVAVGTSIIFSISQTISRGKDALKSLAAVLALVAVFFIAQAFASDAIPNFPSAQGLIDDGTLTPEVSKMADTLLFTMYILLGVAIGSIVYSSVSRIWR